MKKHIAILAVLALCITALHCFAAAAVPEASGIWTDYAAADFAGGTGTETDPYRISTAEQLAKLAKDANTGVPDYNHHGKYFVLTNNIDLKDHRWIPIGTGTIQSSTHSFNGCFDGNGYTINNLYVDESDNGFAAGLFGNFSGSAVGTVSLQNINITNAYITSKQTTLPSPGRSDGVGILIGNATVGYGLEITVKNCKVQGTVTTDSTSPNHCGGLVGSNSYGIYENCEADVVVTGHGWSGGFVGSDFIGKYKSCTSRGSVSGYNSIGGFAGSSEAGAVMEKCISYASVLGKDWHVGGFIGYAWKCNISNCVAMGNVESALNLSPLKAGGFVGTNDSDCDIKNCHFAGKITVSGESAGAAGGFVGYDHFGATTDCSFSTELNPDISAIGSVFEQTDINSILGAKTSAVLENICNDYYGSHEIDSESFTVDVNPTCTEKGSKSNHCIRCDAKVNVTEIPAEGHHYSDNFTVDKNATCTEKGSESRHCEVCDAKTDITDIEPAHTAVKHVAAKEATVNAEGNIEYWFCEDCGKYYADAALEREISRNDTVTAKLTQGTGGSDKEETGDAPLTMLYIALGIVLIAFAGVTVYRKKFLK